MPAGTVVATGAEAGEVVQAGQMIIRVARKDGRDAVFDVPAQVLRSAPSDPLITVSLTDDPTVTATGRVREVSPQADPVTRTFEVKVGLTDPPAAMRLGPTVVGRMQLDTAPVIEIPATALTEFDRRPAVWVVDPQDLTVSLRNVEVARNDPATVAISQGLDTGEIVVTAGTSGAPSRPEDPPAGIRAVMRFNLSEWALGHRSFIVYCMLAVTVVGTAVLLPPRPQRGSGIHLQDDGRAGGMAGRDPAMTRSTR